MTLLKQRKIKHELQQMDPERLINSFTPKPTWCYKPQFKASSKSNTKSIKDLKVTMIRVPYDRLTYVFENSIMNQLIENYQIANFDFKWVTTNGQQLVKVSIKVDSIEKEKEYVLTKTYGLTQLIQDLNKIIINDKSLVKSKSNAGSKDPETHPIVIGFIVPETTEGESKRNRGALTINKDKKGKEKEELEENFGGQILPEMSYEFQMQPLNAEEYFGSKMVLYESRKGHDTKFGIMTDSKLFLTKFEIMELANWKYFEDRTVHQKYRKAKIYKVYEKKLKYPEPIILFNLYMTYRYHNPMDSRLLSSLVENKDNKDKKKASVDINSIPSALSMFYFHFITNQFRSSLFFPDDE